MQNTQFLTIKDVSHLSGLSKNQASKLINDIKDEFGLKTKITLYHYKSYLKLPIVTN